MPVYVPGLKSWRELKGRGLGNSRVPLRVNPKVRTTLLGLYQVRVIEERTFIGIKMQNKIKTQLCNRA